jgi:hypothetical protein
MKNVTYSAKNIQKHVLGGVAAITIVGLWALFLATTVG